MDNKEELVKKWIIKANSDLLTAERLLKFEDLTIDTICFHCQQAVEKYLKAYLIFKEVDFKKVHEIDYLLSLACEIDKEFEEIQNAEMLTDFAVEVRYPEALYFEVSEEEAEKAFKITQNVKEFILKRLVNLNNDSSDRQENNLQKDKEISRHSKRT